MILECARDEGIDLIITGSRNRRGWIQTWILSISRKIILQAPISVLIVHGPDRETAIAGAEATLSRFRLEGIRTTVPLHLRLLGDEAFRSGKYDLDVLSRPGLLPPA